MANAKAPEGRHEIARGASPGYDAKKTNKPRRGGTKMNMDGQDNLRLAPPLLPSVETENLKLLK